MADHDTDETRPNTEFTSGSRLHNVWEQTGIDLKSTELANKAQVSTYDGNSQINQALTKMLQRSSKA